MNTSYDTIYQTFLNNCMVSDIDLPQTNEGKYEVIKNALLHFNNRMRTKYLADDILETLDGHLDEDKLLILAHYIRLIFLKNQKTYFESLWQPFTSDVGIRNFSSQIKSLENSIETQKNTIESFIVNAAEDFL
ncbi:hypothetical protein [Cytobacillus praedii]|uniref:Uncharacterized protein n=1 Tax=Cytobacillus praedii TaxID=1742358 RepID=A0A4R1AMT1_9BACI|nr:hypothetical protein [Cytobacillus praedii]TCJ01080.1 hypothetical protein E0Y62_25780 [Cytobacillus praedii]